MTYAIWYSPKFIDDVVERTTDLDREQSGLGMELYAQVESMAARIRRDPLHWQPDRFGLRRAHLRKFKKHSVHFQVSATTIKLLGLYHDRQDPKTWQR